MSEYMIFCLGKGKYKSEGIGYQKNYMAFNKNVTKERYEDILNLIKYNILKDLKLELSRNNWKDEWKKVTQEQWNKILEIPEADKKVIEGIIGFDIKETKVEELTLDQVCKELGRNIKIIKN